MMLVDWPSLLLYSLLVLELGTCYAEITTFPASTLIRTDEGKDLLSIRCRYHGTGGGDGEHEEPIFTWSGPSVGESRIEITQTSGTSTLRIRDVSASDNGTFKCTHHSGEFATKHVIVNVAPTVEAPSPQRITVGEDDSSLVMCKIDVGYPPELSEVKWYKDGVLLNLNEDQYDATDLDQGLKITDVNPMTDSGTYLCAIEQNGFGTEIAEIEVTFIARSALAPKIDKDAMGYTSEVGCGEDLTLECILKSNSEAADMFVWSTPDGFFSGQRLNVPSPVKSGQYRCIAENDYGTDDHTVSVNALAAPMQLWVNSEVEVVLKGDPIEIGCHLSDTYPGNPLAKVSWSRAGTTVLEDPNQGTFVRNSEKSSTLVITSSMPSDEGDHECVAVNNCGMTSQKVTLNVLPLYINLEICVKTSNSECSLSDDVAQELIETVCSSCSITKLLCDKGQYSITISGVPEHLTEEDFYSALADDGLYKCSSSPPTPTPEPRVGNVPTIASLAVVASLAIIISFVGLTLCYCLKHRSKNRTADISDVEQPPPPPYEYPGQQPTITQFTMTGDGSLQQCAHHQLPYQPPYPPIPQHIQLQRITLQRSHSSTA